MFSNIELNYMYPIELKCVQYPSYSPGHRKKIMKLTWWKSQKGLHPKFYKPQHRNNIITNL